MAGLLSSLGITQKQWTDTNITPLANLSDNEVFSYGEGFATISSLLTNENSQARSRQQIYQQWASMEATPICATAVKILTTTALGGHENTGQAVFLEKTPAALKDKRLEKIADEIISDLTEVINNVIFTLAYRGGVYGDSYARIYSEPKVGIVDLYTDEMLLPSMVLPFQRGSKTIGFFIQERSQYLKMTKKQMLRFEMPRSQYVPQQSVVQKSLKVNFNNDVLDETQILMSCVGGSLLYPAEQPFTQLMSSLASINAQRIRDSLDEAYLTVNMESMTKEQQGRTVESIKKMLIKTKELVDTAITSAKPYNSILRHILPINNEKQITNITPMVSTRSGTVTIDDVMLNARLASAAIGVDLSMIGFSDQLTGMFGDGGMGRVNAMTTEQSRNIRVAARKLVYDVIDIHTLDKYGVMFDKANYPVEVNFYGSILAYEAEAAAAKVNAGAYGMTVIQGMQMFKDIGATKDQMEMMLSKQFLLDEEEARAYATIVDAKPPAGEDGGGFGGDNQDMAQGGIEPIEPIEPAGNDSGNDDNSEDNE
jgi:hypothetical protein